MQWKITEKGFWTFSPRIWFALVLSTERKCEWTDEAGERAKRSAFLFNVTLSNLPKRTRTQHTHSHSCNTHASALYPACITREHACSYTAGAQAHTRILFGMRECD